jgi:transcriptional regulator with XRE-family HTH domain
VMVRIFTDDEVRTRIAQRLRRRRNALGLSAAELSALSGVPRSVIANFEVGRTGLSVVAYVALATALGVDLDNVMRPDDCPVCQGFPTPGYRCQECGQAKALDVACLVCRDKPPVGMACQSCGVS